jgi:hypothetical protein
MPLPLSQPLIEEGALEIDELDLVPITDEVISVGLLER